MQPKVNNQMVDTGTKSLWMGEIEPWMDETQISNLYSNHANVVSVKIIKNKMTGLPAGYGFVEFDTHEEAKRIKDMLNGTQIPGFNKTFRLNWAVQSGGAAKVMPQSVPNVPMSSGGDFSVYVGDLDPNVTDSILLENFSSRYKTILSANVIVDGITKRSKKYGFVRFSNQEESQRAIMEMNGQYILSRPIKLNVGFKKSNMQQQQPQHNSGSYGAGGGGYQGYGQAPAPSYPPAYGGYNDPYGGGKQGYGYGGGYDAGYNSHDPYGSSSYSNYGSYPSYPPPASGGAYGGSGSGASSYPPAASGGYDSYQSSYPSYGGSNAYGDTTSQSYPPASSAPAATSGGYQYSSYYGTSGGYDYGTAASQAPVAAEPETQAPVQAAKEVDYDLDEDMMTPLYNEETTTTENQDYFKSLMEASGTVDLTI